MAFDIAAPTYFQNEHLPDGTRPVGWVALVHGLGLTAPVRQISCVSEKHISGSQRQEGKWLIFDKRYAPEDRPLDHIVFALKHENIDLLISKVSRFFRIRKLSIQYFYPSAADFAKLMQG